MEIDYKTNEVKEHVAFIYDSLEVLYDEGSGTLWSESPEFTLFVEQYDIWGTFLPTSSFSFPGVIQTALQYANGSLFGTGFLSEGCDEVCPSELFQIDLSTQSYKQIGYTGGWQISGLAYDENREILYGVTDGALPALLIVIDLNTGLGSEVGPIMVDGEPLYAVGSIEFDGDGVLRGCLARTDYQLDQLLTIDPATGEATFSGVPLGYTCSGLTLVCK